MNRNFNPPETLIDREKNLAQLARALLNSASQEDDPERLELHRHIALKLKQILDKTANQDKLLSPDLGLELLLFIELKRDGNTEAKFDRQEVMEILAGIEAKHNKI